MAESVVQIRVNGQDWNGKLLGDFAQHVGFSLQTLEEEYDEMIQRFEAQRPQLRDFAPTIDGTLEKNSHLLSPESSEESFKKKRKKKRSFSSAGISSSIRKARNSIRRKLSLNRPLSPSHRQTLRRKKETSSMSSLSRNDSE